jgi:flavin-dependent dehydrogenase
MFDRMLVDAASAAGVDVRCGTTLLDCVFDGRDWRLQIQDSCTRQSRQLRASVAIDATGRSARLARAMGQQRIVFDRLVGVAVLSRERDPSRDGYVLVEAAPEGWWYSAPVGPDCLMTMFMTDSDLCGRARLSTLSRWRELLVDAPNTAAHIRGTEVWGPKVFSARSQRLGRRDFNAPWLSVGDAALSVDPISGSGVVRALRSARAAAAAALKLLDTPSHQTIEAYEADRDAECTTYLRERASYYGFEQRWQQFPFWWRRTATVEEDR